MARSDQTGIRQGERSACGRASHRYLQSRIFMVHRSGELVWMLCTRLSSTGSASARTSGGRFSPAWKPAIDMPSARALGDRATRVMCAHEPEDPEGNAPVSRASHAAGLKRCPTQAGVDAPRAEAGSTCHAWLCRGRAGCNGFRLPPPLLPIGGRDPVANRLHRGFKLAGPAPPRPSRSCGAEHGSSLRRASPCHTHAPGRKTDELPHTAVRGEAQAEVFRRITPHEP